MYFCRPKVRYFLNTPRILHTCTFVWVCNSRVEFRYATELIVKYSNSGLDNTINRYIRYKLIPWELFNDLTGRQWTHFIVCTGSWPINYDASPKARSPICWELRVMSSCSLSANLPAPTSGYIARQLGRHWIYVTYWRDYPLGLKSNPKFAIVLYETHKV
jgi:hypothetical protein